MNKICAPPCARRFAGMLAARSARPAPNTRTISCPRIQVASRSVASSILALFGRQEDMCATACEIECMRARIIPQGLSSIRLATGGAKADLATKVWLSCTFHLSRRPDSLSSAAYSLSIRSSMVNSLQFQWLYPYSFYAPSLKRLFWTGELHLHNRRGWVNDPADRRSLHQN